jgi:DNA-binding NtrC family response regulator
MKQCSKFSILFVDDEENILSCLKRYFIKENHQFFTATSGEIALDLMAETRIDLALVDLVMPGMDGLTLLKKIKQSYPETVVIMLTGGGGISDAVKAIKFGASDFILKPSSSEELRAKLLHFYQIWKLKIENEKFRNEQIGHFKFDSMLGNSEVMIKLKRMIAQVGPGDASILIQGETGTGKELIARAIHNHSDRKNKAFIPVDCAALNATLMESELFGHAKGAFTGAHIASQGLFKAADGGTLFLDEIGELPLSMQVKLLRSIQEKEIRPVGSTKTIPVDARILSATNCILAEEISKGNFREDLYYRVNMIEINPPPLRERSDDIILLARFFIKQFKHEVSPVRDIATETIDYLLNYKWPGNIRELENVIRRAISLGRNEFIRPDNLPDTIYTKMPETPDQPLQLQSEDGSIESYEKAAIKNALEMSNNNRKEASAILGIGEATLYRKLKKYFDQ